MKVIIESGGGARARNINDYRDSVQPMFPEISQYQVILSRFGLSFKPWQKWEVGESPLWWRAYNAVKHERNQNFDSASLKHCLNAVAGLYVAVIHAYPEMARAGDLAPLPKLMGVHDDFHTGTRLGRHGISFKYVVNEPLAIEKA